MDKGIIIHSAIIADGKLLILKRAPGYLGNYWDIPGGTLEDGEDPADGAIRETLEETRLKIGDLELFFHYSNIDTEKNKHFITLIFLAKVQSDPSTIKLSPKEHSEYKWIDLDEIAEYQTVAYLPLLANALKTKMIA